MRIVFPEIIDTFFSKLSFNEIEPIAQVHLWDGLMQVQPNRLFEQGLRDLSLVLVLWKEELACDALQLGSLEFVIFCHWKICGKLFFDIY